MIVYKRGAILLLESQPPWQFSSNLLQHICQVVSSHPEDLDYLGLELNLEGQWPSRRRVGYPWSSSLDMYTEFTQSPYLKLDFPVGYGKVALDISERPVKSDEKSFTHTAPRYPIQQLNLKWFCFVTVAKNRNACNIADCGRYEIKRARYRHFTFTSHHSFQNSQQFFTHHTYFLACLADRGFDLSHLSSVNQLWLTAWPCLPMGGPDSLTALWQSSQWKLLCIILYIIVHTFLTIKARLKGTV